MRDPRVDPLEKKRAMIRRKLKTMLLFATASAAAYGDVLVVPNAQGSAPGNLPIKLGGNSIRLQEIVGGGQFPGPIMITGLRVRSAPGAGPVNSAIPSFQMTLSTTAAYPNTANGHTLPSQT